MEKSRGVRTSSRYARPALVKLGSIGLGRGFNGKLLDTVHGGHCYREQRLMIIKRSRTAVFLLSGVAACLLSACSGGPSAESRGGTFASPDGRLTFDLGQGWVLDESNERERTFVLKPNPPPRKATLFVTEMARWKTDAIPEDADAFRFALHEQGWTFIREEPWQEGLRHKYMITLEPGKRTWFDIRYLAHRDVIYRIGFMTYSISEAESEPHREPIFASFRWTDGSPRQKDRIKDPEEYPEQRHDSPDGGLWFQLPGYWGPGEDRQQEEAIGGVNTSVTIRVFRLWPRGPAHMAALAVLSFPPRTGLTFDAFVRELLARGDQPGCSALGTEQVSSPAGSITVHRFKMLKGKEHFYEDMVFLEGRQAWYHISYSWWPLACSYGRNDRNHVYRSLSMK